MKQNTDGQKDYFSVGAYKLPALGTELTCAQCSWNGSVGKELPNPFKFVALDRITGKGESGHAVTYSVISFIDKNGNASEDPHMASVVRFDPATDSDGFSRAYLKLGSAEGTYVVRAVCPDCTGNHEQIARGYARRHEIITETEEISSADPSVNAANCPSGCCPLTPVLRITEKTLHNDNKSFTTVPPEDAVGLTARLLPQCLDQNLIHWTVADDPGDFYNSGAPFLPVDSGNNINFLITADGITVPPAPQGRPAPLKYRALASATIDGNPVHSRYEPIQQDEIDKCRQEYLDWSKPEINESLTSGEYFPRYARNTFTTGVDGEKDPDYVRYMDCYAYIYPSREQEAENLRTNTAINFPIDVTSGYRSPRKNRLQKPAGVWNSEHQFGDAVDIIPKNVTTQNRAMRFKALWDNTNCPKILETGTAKPMALCKAKNDPITYKAKSSTEFYNESNMFELANCLHLGK